MIDLLSVLIIYLMVLILLLIKKSIYAKLTKSTILKMKNKKIRINLITSFLLLLLSVFVYIKINSILFLLLSIIFSLFILYEYYKIYIFQNEILKNNNVGKAQLAKHKLYLLLSLLILIICTSMLINIMNSLNKTWVY